MRYGVPLRKLKATIIGPGVVLFESEASVVLALRDFGQDKGGPEIFLRAADVLVFDCEATAKVAYRAVQTAFGLADVRLQKIQDQLRAAIDAVRPLTD